MSDLNFDPNEQVVHFGRENHRPINRPQAGAAAPEQAQRPSGATPRPVPTAGWKYVNEIVTKLPNGIWCKFKHNFGSNLLADSMKQSMSLVCGHLHSKSNISWWQNDMGMNFAMQVGCLIDDNSPAFDYNKGQALRPVMSCGIIKNGIPIILPMYLNKSKRWKGYL
jgi:hypothetical protein